MKRQALRKAFSNLRKKNILAKMNFSCCQSCGISEITTLLKEKPHSYIGYVFFDLQDAEDLRDTGKCYLSFGSLEDDEISNTKIALLAMQELKKVGIMTDCSVGSRIGININEEY